MRNRRVNRGIGVHVHDHKTGNPRARSSPLVLCKQSQGLRNARLPVPRAPTDRHEALLPRETTTLTFEHVAACSNDSMIEEKNSACCFYK